MNKYEKLIEYIINDDEQKARELFHSIVVERSREIYESIMDEEQMEENVAGDQVGDLVDEIGAEESMHEEEDGFGDDEAGEEEFSLDDGDDEGLGGDLGGEEAGEEAAGDDAILNIDSKLDELLAKFDEIMGTDGAEAADEVGGEEEIGGDEFGGEEGSEEFGGEEEGSEEGVMEGENPFAKSGKSGSAKSGSAKSGSAKSGKSGKSGSGKTESRKSSAELMREYVEKIEDITLAPSTYSEGEPVGATGKKVSVNTDDIVGPGANFGGKAATSKGGQQNQDGTAPTKASNEYNKGQGEIKSGNVNVPGGKAGKTGFKAKEGSYETDGKGQGSETGKTVGSGAGDKPAINKQSELGQAGRPTGKK